jgi:hypothetical protein
MLTPAGIDWADMPTTTGARSFADELAALNEWHFFREFVYSQTTFRPIPGREVELADSIVCLGDVLIAYQLKEREHAVESRRRWHSKKATYNKAYSACIEGKGYSVRSLVNGDTRGREFANEGSAGRSVGGARRAATTAPRARQVTLRGGRQLIAGKGRWLRREFQIPESPRLFIVATGRHTRTSLLVLRSPQYQIVGHRRCHRSSTWSDRDRSTKRIERQR